MLLFQFFEATTTEGLKPTGSGTGGFGFPNEIYEMILAEVTDIKTYNACMKVSRRFRSLYHQRPLVMDYILFLEPIVSQKTEQGNGKWRAQLAKSRFSCCGMLFGSANER